MTIWNRYFQGEFWNDIFIDAQNRVRIEFIISTKWWLEDNSKYETFKDYEVSVV